MSFESEFVKRGFFVFQNVYLARESFGHHQNFAIIVLAEVSLKKGDFEGKIVEFSKQNG